MKKKGNKINGKTDLENPNGEATRLITFGVILFFVLSSVPLSVFGQLRHHSVPTETFENGTNETIAVKAKGAGHKKADDPLKVKTFKVDGPATLKMFTPSGNIEVESSAAYDEIEVELYVERGFALWSSSKNLDNYHINMLQRGNEIIASVEQKSKSSGWSDGVNFNFKVKAPKELSSELKTLGGHVRLDGMKGDQKLRSSGGHLKLDNIIGNIKAFTSGGHIELNDIQGSVMAYTQGGHIEADGVHGELRLKSNAGNISGGDLRGYIAASTSAGNIEVEMLSMERGLSLESKAGNVTAEIPGNSGYNVYISGTGAELKGDSNFSGERSGNVIKGVVNDGGIKISLSSKFGNALLQLD